MRLLFWIAVFVVLMHYPALTLLGLLLAAPIALFVIGARLICGALR